MNSEATPPPSFDGSVLLDIGGSDGALIVVTSESLCGQELELRSKGAVSLEVHTEVQVHTEVRERRLSKGRVFAAVFPKLSEGEYELVCNGQKAPVRGGSVSEIVLDESLPLESMMARR